MAALASTLGDSLGRTPTQSLKLTSLIPWANTRVTCTSRAESWWQLLCWPLIIPAITCGLSFAHLNDLWVWNCYSTFLEIPVLENPLFLLFCSSVEVFPLVCFYLGFIFQKFFTILVYCHDISFAFLLAMDFSPFFFFCLFQWYFWRKNIGHMHRLPFFMLIVSYYIHSLFCILNAFIWMPFYISTKRTSLFFL